MKFPIDARQYIENCVKNKEEAEFLQAAADAANIFYRDGLAGKPVVMKRSRIDVQEFEAERGKKLPPKTVWLLRATCLFCRYAYLQGRWERA